MKKFLSYFLVFLLGTGAGLGGLLLFDQYKDSQPKEISRETENATTEKTSNKFSLKKSVSAYLVWWDQDNGFATLKANKDKIEYLKLFWYGVADDGSLVKYSGAENREILKFVQNNNIKTLATISNDNDPEKLRKVLHDPEVQAKHIQDLLKLLKKQKYDGLNINYESLKGLEDRDAYSSFMQKLATEVHKQKKLFSTELHAKVSEKASWEGPEAQDWKTLADTCDFISIMAYDYHWQTSEAGEIAPLSWIREILNYAVQVIPKEKLQLGIHFYGYDWLGEQARDLNFNDVQELISRYNPSIAYSLEKEKTFNYTKDAEKHTVYFADADTVWERLKIIQEYEIQGISIWRIGQEDPKNWQKIQEILG